MTGSKPHLEIGIIKRAAWQSPGLYRPTAVTGQVFHYGPGATVIPFRDKMVVRFTISGIAGVFDLNILAIVLKALVRVAAVKGCGVSTGVFVNTP